MVARVAGQARGPGGGQVVSNGLRLIMRTMASWATVNPVASESDGAEAASYPE